MFRVVFFHTGEGNYAGLTYHHMMHGFLFKVWATGQWKVGECAIVFQFLGYMLSLSFLASVLSFSNQKPCVTNPMPILYISPMTDKKTTHHMAGGDIQELWKDISWVHRDVQGNRAG